jgi:hypothetical protein
MVAEGASVTLRTAHGHHKAETVEDLKSWLRCLGCADMRPVLDSAERWTYPPAWACGDCSQSIAEVAFGVTVDGDAATWMAVAARCVECQSVAGLTDLVVPGLPADAFVASL